jgi:aerobic carbon-monoxide dehydrogenase medium subunit
MVAAAFDYVLATSYEDAVAQLVAGGDEAKVLAGGQSLMPVLNLRLARPALLVDINHADTRSPAVEYGMLALPALTRHRMLMEHELVRTHCPLLADAISYVGNVRVRNRGTIGGSLAHADPTSEIGCCALASGARVTVRGPAAVRTIPASELFAGYWSTTLAEPEIITDVLIPTAPPRQGWSFQEIDRRASDFAVVAVAALVSLAADGARISAASIALAGVADRVVLADPELTAGLVGQTADGAADDMAAAIAGSLQPPTDLHATGGYRREVARVLIARAIRQACARAGGSGHE